MFFSCVTAVFLLTLSSLTVVSGHTLGTDAVSYFYANIPSGSKCGPQRPVTGWENIVDRYRPADGTGASVNNGQFSGGIFTTPAAGVYHCCASFRCKQGGYCDWTVIRNGGTTDQVIGAFGTRNTGISSNGWASHSICVLNRAQAGVTFRLTFESGSSSTDCIEETLWRYGTFSCYLATRL
eukprot:GFUD01011750.1.p1 GENE.GFUD01011750.1~~GFUD01011750.1.p1  ORF type:complete len:205 (-),score=25.34 GFUD01011750.1:59-601(-)